MIAERTWSLGLGLIATIVLARYLGAADYGLLQFAASVCGLLSLLATLGLDGILVREIVQHPEREGELLGTAATLRMVTAIILLGVLAVAARFVSQDGRLALMILTIAFALLPQAASVIEFSFQARVMSRRSSLARAVAATCGSMLILMGVAAGCRVPAFAGQPLIEAIVLSIGLWISYLRVRPVNTRWHFSADLARQLLRECWPLMFSLGLISIYVNIDRVMVRMLLSDEATGLYAAATKLSEGWYFLPTVIVNSVFPALVKAKEVSIAFYHRRLQHLYDLMVWLGIAVAVPVWLVSDDVMALLFGESFRAAGSVLGLHIWAGALVSLGLASGRWMVLEGMVRAYLARTVLAVVVNVLGNYILIPRYGISGAALATILAQVAVVLLFDAFWSKTRVSFWMKCRALFPLHWFLRKDYRDEAI